MPHRILHVIPDLGHGGAEHQLLKNIERLDRQNFESHVCHLYPRAILAPALEQAGATVHSMAVSGPLAAPRRLWKLVRLIREIRPDLIHTSNVLGEFYGGIAGRLTGVPVVGTFTNTSDRQVRTVDHPHLNMFKLNTVAAFRRKVIRHTHMRHIAISEHVAKSATQELKVDPGRTVVIHRGIDSSELTRSASEVDAVRYELGLDSHFPVLLNVGRLVPQKGQRYLIEAMPAILERHPDALLLIVGVGFLEKRLTGLVQELGLEGSVRFLGRKDDVPTLMGASDIFVFPSLFEGLGVSLLEACATTMPIIATTAGPIPEIVQDGDTGLLVPPANPQAISEAILKLAADEGLRSRLANAAARRVNEHFTVEQAVASLGKFYSETLASTGARV